MPSTVTCFLCRQRPAIDNSHILPKLIVTAIVKELSDRGWRRMSTPRLRVEQTTVDPLLCTVCEAEFQRYEDDFARSCLYPYFADDQIVIEHRQQLLMFSVSVLWRVLVHTLDKVPVGERPPYLVQAAEWWRAYLRRESRELGQHKCYLFLDREFSADQIRSSRSLSSVDLRFMIGQGFKTVTHLFGAPFRDVVHAKLGPFIFVGILKDVFHGQIDHLMEPWREIVPDPQARNVANDGFRVPVEIVDMIDELSSHWQVSEDDMKPERRVKLKAGWSSLPPDSMLKRIYQRDGALFRQPKDPQGE